MNDHMNATDRSSSMGGPPMCGRARRRSKRTCFASTRRHGRDAHATTRSAGFTLVEVLATVLLIAIVIPAVMEGVSISGQLASNAKHHTIAAGLAESKLNEMIATNQWQGQSTLSGDFSPDAPDYTWKMDVAPWSGDTTSQSIQQVDVTVTWQSRGQPRSITVSTLTYVRASSSGSTG